MDDVAAKRAAGEAAARLIPDGCRVGLGTGSTAAWFIRALGDRVRDGLRVSGVATSEAAARLAADCGIALRGLDSDGVDVAVDGADEVDARLRLIKGQGGAMLREKIVAAAAARFVVVVDPGKLRERLTGPVPVELLEFAAVRTIAALRLATGGVFTLRSDASGAAVRSDNGNLIADGAFERLGDPGALAAQLEAIPGVLGHGLFLGMTDRVLVGHADGTVREIQPVR